MGTGGIPTTDNIPETAEILGCRTNNIPETTEMSGTLSVGHPSFSVVSSILSVVGIPPLFSVKWR